jgi:ribonuclease D
VTGLAESLNLPQENLITPDTVRRLCWEPPAEHSVEAVSAFLAEHGARPWQIAQTATLLAAALATAA